jgi:MoaA/NifB/PqqE/SkfB family radical SAM enzyme
MFHANYAVGVEDKIALLRYAKNCVNSGNTHRIINNFLVFPQLARKKLYYLFKQRIVQKVIDQEKIICPKQVCLDASTICQLRCKSCPNASLKFRKGIGLGYLKFADFQGFIQKNPKVKSIELSNWGELFLNPEITSIIRYAHEKKVRLTAFNGTNFNDVTDEILESLVLNKFYAISFSIDGCSQETYSQYRSNGDYNKVVSNIRKLTALKSKYKTQFPLLYWQFIAFRHNEHEIRKARSFAAELGANFRLKLSWDDLYTESFSTVENSEVVKNETGLGVSNREEYYQKYSKDYIADTCLQLWFKPRINFDGKLLGCSVNYWEDYGNVFEQGLKSCLESERYQYAKKMLRSIVPERNDIPCSDCPVYHKMRMRSNWVRISDIIRKQSRLARFIFSFKEKFLVLGK